MIHQHERRPDLDDCCLEERILPASFLDSTFFEPPAFSGIEPGLSGNTAAPGVVNVNVSQGVYFILPTGGASYSGFGSNPFGLGLSPLDGVVSAYSINTALSNILGSGSSEPAATREILGFGYLPAAATAVSATAAGGVGVQNQNPNLSPFLNRVGVPGAGAGPAAVVRNYSSTFRSGFGFGIDSRNNYGMGPQIVGPSISARLGHIGGAAEPRMPNPPLNPSWGYPGDNPLIAPPSRPGERVPRAAAPPMVPPAVPVHPGVPAAPGPGAVGPATPAPPHRDRPQPAPLEGHNHRQPPQSPRGTTEPPPGGWSVPQGRQPPAQAQPAPPPEPTPSPAPGGDG